jgi:hypothetical protein
MCPVLNRHVFKGNVSCVVDAELGCQVLNARLMIISNKKVTCQQLE